MKPNAKRIQSRRISIYKGFLEDVSVRRREHSDKAADYAEKKKLFNDIGLR